MPPAALTTTTNTVCFKGIMSCPVLCCCCFSIICFRSDLLLLLFLSLSCLCMVSSNFVCLLSAALVFHRGQNTAFVVPLTETQAGINLKWGKIIRRLRRQLRDTARVLLLFQFDGRLLLVFWQVSSGCIRSKDKHHRPIE